MRGKLAFIGLLCLMGIGVWVGCEEEDEEGEEPWWYGEVSSIAIEFNAYHDTLHIWYWDTTTTSFTISVLDDHGNGIQGVPVEVFVLDDSLGEVEFPDTLHANYTDATGEVNARFRSYGREGRVTILAHAGREYGYGTLALILEHWFDPPYFHVWLNPPVLTVDSGEVVNTTVTVQYASQFYEPYVGVLPLCSITGGSIGSLGPTDSMGRSQADWQFIDEFGEFAVTVRVPFEETYLTDSVHIVIRNLTLTSPDTIWLLSPDQGEVWYVLEGDSQQFYVDALVLDRLRDPVEGVRVEFAASDSTLGRMEFSDSRLLDTTDHHGRSNVRFLSYGRSGSLTISACVGEICDSNDVTVYAELPFFQRLDLNLDLDPDSIQLDSNSFGQTLLWTRVRLVDINGSYHIVHGAVPVYEVTGGGIQPPTPTDNSGYTTSWWSFQGEVGSFGLRVQIQYEGFSAVDSIQVTVHPHP